MIDDLIKLLSTMPESEKQNLIRDTQSILKETYFTPSPGPQSDAYFSKADILLFGGQPRRR